MNNNRTFGQIVSASKLKLPDFDCKQTVGIDKLSVICNDFEVSSLVPFELVAERKKAGQEQATQNKLFDLTNGTPVFGSKAFLNTKTANYSISSTGTLIVNCNPSKVYFPSQHFGSFKRSCVGSYRLVTEAEQLEAVFSAVEDDARSHGLNFDFGNSRTFRLDLCKQAEMTRPFADYLPAFDALRLKYSKASNVQHGTQTYQYGSTSSNTQVVLYDKLEELLKAEKQRLPSSSDFLRAELRLLNAKTVEAMTEARTANALVKLPVDQLNATYNSYLSKRLFGIKQTELFPDEKSFSELVRHFVTEQHRKNGRGAFHQIVRTVGVTGISETVGIERFIQLYGSVLQEVTDGNFDSVNRSLRRYRNELHQLSDTASALYKTVEVVDLLSELRSALVA